MLCSHHYHFHPNSPILCIYLNTRKVALSVGDAFVKAQSSMSAHLKLPSFFYQQPWLPAGQLSSSLLASPCWQRIPGSAVQQCCRGPPFLPRRLSVSREGSRLQVLGQRAETLHVPNTDSQTVLQKASSVYLHQLHIGIAY